MKLLYFYSVTLMVVVGQGSFSVDAVDVQKYLQSCRQVMPDNISVAQAITIACASYNLATDLYDCCTYQQKRYYSGLDNRFIVQKKLRYPSLDQDGNVDDNPWVVCWQEKHYNQRYAQSVSMACSAATLALCGYTIYHEMYQKKGLLSTAAKLSRMICCNTINLAAYMTRSNERRGGDKKRIYAAPPSTQASSSRGVVSEYYEDEEMSDSPEQVEQILADAAMNADTIDLLEKEQVLLNDIRLYTMQQLVEHVKFTMIRDLIKKAHQSHEDPSPELFELYNNQIKDAAAACQGPLQLGKHVTFVDDCILYKEDDYNHYNDGKVFSRSREYIFLTDQIIRLPKAYCDSPKNVQELAFLKDTFTIIDAENCRIDFEETEIAVKVINQYLGKLAPNPNQLLSQNVPVGDIPYIIMSPRSFMILHADLPEALQCKNSKLYCVETGKLITGIRRCPSGSTRSS